MNQNHLFIYRLKFDCEFQIFNVISDFLPPNEHLLVNNAVLISIFEGRKKKVIRARVEPRPLAKCETFLRATTFHFKGT